MEKICNGFPGKIAVGIDAKKDFVATGAWSKTSRITVSEMVKTYEIIGRFNNIYRHRKRRSFSGSQLKK